MDEISLFSPDHKKVMKLIMEEASMKDIADSIGWTVSKTKTIIHRLRDALRENRDQRDSI